MNEAAIEDAAVDMVADKVAAATTVGSGDELLYVGSPVGGAEGVSLGVSSVVTVEGGSTVGFLEGAWAFQTTFWLDRRELCRLRVQTEKSQTNGEYLYGYSAFKLQAL